MQGLTFLHTLSHLSALKHSYTFLQWAAFVTMKSQGMDQFKFDLFFKNCVE